MRTFHATLAGLALLHVSAVAAAAQQPGEELGLRARTHAGFGYVVNLPRQMMGFNAFVITPALRNWGVYADYKKTIDSTTGEATYDPDMTVEEAEGFGDVLLERESDWETINFAIIRVMSPALALYLGGGVSKESGLRRYFDETATRGVLGSYWVDDPSESGNRVNVMGGAWFRITPSFLVQFGAEAAPAGGTVGISYVLPIGR